MNPMTSDELKAAFAALPPMDPVDPPEHSWRFHCWDLRQNVASNDPTEFLTWPGVVGTMFVGNAPYTKCELGQLPLSYKGPEILEEADIGQPALYDTGWFSSSGNLIHQAYHFAQWETRQSKWVGELETIIEIGGGYGAMALICHRLGFRGQYIIYDLPEFSLLQQYYLSNVGVDNVEFKTQIEKRLEADLLIGLYSLSEMPLYARETITDLCSAQSYLIAYQAAWDGIDNMAWVMEIMKRKGYDWRTWNIPHLPNCWYLVGDRSV